MKATEIYKILNSLNPSENPNEYNMNNIHQNLFAAKSSTGLHCIIVEYPIDVHLPGGRSTKGLSLEFFSSTDFLINGVASSSCWAVITCLDNSQIQLFSVLAEGILTALTKGSMQQPKDVSDYITDWQELLSSTTSFSLKQCIGLWGELQLIFNSPSIERAVEVWQGPNSKKFDFSNNGVDIEVKTSLKGHYHSFSEGQLAGSASGSDRYIYSIHAEEDIAGGKTTTDLINEVRKCLPRLEQFEKKLIAYGYTGPLDNELSLSVRNDKLVSIKDVPKVQQKDMGVYNVKFESDLTFTSSVKQPKTVIKKILK